MSVESVPEDRVQELLVLQAAIRAILEENDFQAQRASADDLAGMIVDTYVQNACHLFGHEALRCLALAYLFSRFTVVTAPHQERYLAMANGISVILNQDLRQQQAKQLQL